ncbi:MAG: Thioredoxin 2 [Eubacteriales bacterium SKADARSKE-1]|nr:Thioredoxin 2 [Eubacteriales bacterium SKADARSKE-1]
MSITILTKDNFESEVKKSQIPVLIDFFASWCGHCKMLAPVIDMIANEVDNVKICKLDIDKESDIAKSFQIDVVPTLVLIKNNKVINSSVGVLKKEKIIDMLKDATASAK